MSVSVNCYAKINLTLEIQRKRPDGYHELKSVMQSIGLYDVIYLEPGPAGIELLVYPGPLWQGEFNAGDVPCDSRNLAWRAAQLLYDYTGLKVGVKIRLVKNIPVAAGLAGGSADAAGVLAGMNRLFGLDIDKASLMRLGRELGADVPFCLHGGTALASGVGDIIEPLPLYRPAAFIVVTPNMQVPTPLAYSVYDRMSAGCEKCMPGSGWKKMKEALVSGPHRAPQFMINDFEEVVFKLYPSLLEVKNFVNRLAGNALLSGSGPTVFGVIGAGWFPEEKLRDEICRQGIPARCWVVPPGACGVSVESGCSL